MAMDNNTTLTAANAQAVRNRETSFTTSPSALDRWTAMPGRSKVSLVMGLAMLMTVVTALVMWSRQGDWRVLYANLADKDAGAVVAQLSQMNVPYRHADSGQAIMIPADKVHDVRFKLAQAGLPKGAVNGFELMDNARFGQTQFQERVSFQRGLEGELVRSIGSLSAVQSARVHLALPQQNGFFREQQKPRASVLLSLHPGRALDRTQIAGIVHLVSSSVPELNPRAVSVLDQSGALLSGLQDEGAAQRLDAQQLQYLQEVEMRYVKRLIDLLEPVVGRDNLRASVTADIDFTQTEATAEAYKPNQGKDPAAVRSAQTSETSGTAPGKPSGVPGAASNQPQQAATAPITGASSPLQAAAGDGAAGSMRRDSVTNYEVDKTVRVTRNATGTVKRLNAAIVVNHRSTTDPKGAVTTAPLPAEELDKLTALAQEAVGFSKERGDSVKVINAAFRADQIPKADSMPLWQQPWLLELLRAVGVPAALALVALVVVFVLIKPALKAAPGGAAGAAPGAQLQAVVNNAVALPGGPGLAPASMSTEQQLMHARELARQNPEAVASIVRGWVNGAPA